jgi:O-antigen ligase
MLLYAALALFTATYSLYPLLTVWKAFEVITHVAVAMVLARRVTNVADAIGLLGLVWISMLFIAFSLLVGVVVSPSEALVTLEQSGISTLAGVAFTVNTNTATQIGGLVVLFAASALVFSGALRGRWVLLLVLFLGVAVMLLARSRTSMFATILGLLIIAFFARRSWLLILLFLCGAAVMLSAAATDVITAFFLRGQSEEQFAGLSGRAYAWEPMWETFLDRPILGYGFYAGIRVLFGLPGADNTYLQVLLSGGLVLLTVFMVPIFCISIDLFRSRPRRSRKGLDHAHVLLWMQTATLFSMLMVRSVTGPSFDSHHPNLTLFLLCSIAASTLRRHISPRSQHAAQHVSSSLRPRGATG